MLRGGLNRPKAMSCGVDPVSNRAKPEATETTNSRLSLPGGRALCSSL